MKRKNILILMSIFMLISMACGFASNNGGGQETDQISSTSAAISTTEQAIPVEMSQVNLGEIQNVSEGGFSFRTIPGYEVNIDGGMVSMIAQGADPDLGPIMQLIGSKTEVDMTNANLFDQLINGTPMTVSAPQAIDINGYSGLKADISASNNGKSMQGQAALVMVTPRQQFVLIFGAPQDEWSRVEPYFNAVLSSVEFVEMISPEPTSNMVSGSYAYTNNNVVRDIIVSNNMAYAATLGGMVAWNLDSQYSMVYTPLQGMGHVSAVSIVACQIPEPRIIVGTLQGISIYDPATGLWEKRSLFPEESKVSSSKVTRLYCDQANNRLLIGYGGVGILDLNTGDFQRITKQEGLAWEEVTDIAVSGKDIWIATGYKGVAKITGTSVTTYSLENGMPDERAFSVATTRDGTLWVGASSGLMSFKGGKWTLFGNETEAKLTDINEIEISSDGKIWVATAPLGGGRICLFNPTTGSCESEYKDPEFQAILALSLDQEMRPLFGTSKGLYRYDGNEAQALITDSKLVSNFVDAFSTSPDGKLWIGTDGGIQQLDPADPQLPWVTFTKSQTPGLGGNWASAIASGSNGTVWFALINGEACKLEDGIWTSFKDIYSFNVVTVDAENRAWFGDDGKGIIVLNPDGSQSMTFSAANGLPGDKVYALLTDLNGTVWIGTDNGLAKYENGKLETVFGKDDTRLPNRYIRDLALAPDGKLIIGMFTGVARYDGNQVEILLDFLKQGYSDLRLTTLAVDKSGQIWIGTDKGLLKPDQNQNWTRMTTENGLLTNYISALSIDQFDAVWVGGGGSNFDGGGILQIVP